MNETSMNCLFYYMIMTVILVKHIDNYTLKSLCSIAAKGLSINVNIFTSVQTTKFQGERGGGVCENQHFFHTLLTFWPDFFNFHGDFVLPKNVNVYSFREGGLRECMVCTLMKMLTFMDSP